MPTDELVAHVRDILECCGVPAGKVNTAAVDRLNLAIRLAVAAERERCLAAAREVGERLEPDYYGAPAVALATIERIRSAE